MNIPISILTTNWETRAVIDNTNLNSSGGVEVDALEDAEVKNRQGAVTASGNIAGSVGVALTNYNADTVAEITDSNLSG